MIRERGPLTVAAFMELALYHPELGYYARAPRRSGRAGDFFTSVDTGPLFGELVEIQLAEMWQILARTANLEPGTRHSEPAFDLVEVGAGNARLAADVLRAARRTHPEFYEALRVHLVEASAAARGAQRATLGDVVDRLVFSSATMPESFEGALVANELLDAMPVHQVVMRDDGLREVYVAADLTDTSRLVLEEGPPSIPALAAHLDRLGVQLEPGWRVEINLRAVDWIRDAAARLRRGFIVLIDYGHEARELYSASHSAGTLTTFSGHRSQGPEWTDHSWLHAPGDRDITSHVDFTSVRAAAEAEGLQMLGFLDQTYFLLGLLPGMRDPQGALRSLKTLIMPGGLGSTHKVLIFGKGVGTPSLRGCSFRVRVT